MAVAMLLCVAALARGADPPNVVLILADDLAIGDLSCFNDGLTRTPRLDRLVAESVYFDHAYSGSAVCAPSRAALLTGRFPHRTGVVTLNPRKFPEMTRLHLDEVTLADRFSATGYATGIVGKWHTGSGAKYHPLKRGFDEFAGFNESWDIKTYFQYQLDIQGEYQNFDGPYLTDELTDRAVDFIRRHRDEPFFLHLAHYAPHRPLSAPQEIIERYTAKGLNERTATVYAMVEVMDTGIGVVLDELESLGLDRKTLVIFSSDNGPDPLVGERFNGDNRGTKYMINEGGIHVPLMVRWKDVLQPAQRDEIVHFTDVVPTLMEICHLNHLPEEKLLDGGSFAGLLSGAWQPSELPDQRFWQWNRGRPLYSHNAAVRAGDWKLVRPYVTRNIPDGSSGAAPRLYNLANDPSETVDHAADKPELCDQLFDSLDKWSRDVEHDRLRLPPASAP
jgi:arylsulfatase A